MALFEKKFCDICGEKIGLLGNRKLEDGNICKNCAGKLSPFFSDRKRSTLEEIKQQLAYREQNEQNLNSFHPTMTLGNSTKVYIDQQQGKFIVSSSSDWRKKNPDIIDISQVTGCETRIEEHKTEIFYKSPDGKNTSFNPRRYEYSYEFETVIYVNSPWFNEIKFELSSFSNRPKSQYDFLYSELQRQGETIRAALMPGACGVQQSFGYQPGFQQPGFNQPGFQQGAMGFSQPVNMNQGYPQQGFQQNYGQPVNMNQGYPQQGFQQQYQQAPGQQQGFNQGYPQQGFNQGGGFNQPQGFQQQYQQTPGQQQFTSPVQQDGPWTCPSCGAVNNTKFCQSCGTPRS